MLVNESSSTHFLSLLVKRAMRLVHHDTHRYIICKSKTKSSGLYRGFIRPYNVSGWKIGFIGTLCSKKIFLSVMDTTPLLLSFATTSELDLQLGAIPINEYSWSNNLV